MLLEFSGPVGEGKTAAACRLFSRGVIFTRSRFARSTIPEEKWGTTRSLNDELLLNTLTLKNVIFFTTLAGEDDFHALY